MQNPDAQNNQPTVRVWDPVVRLFHWSLVAGMAAAWISSSSRSVWHQWIGLGVAGLILVRIVWGVVGSRNARFQNFVRGPVSILRYVGAILRGKERRFLGHNPAGGAMILALMTMILLTVVTGWLMTTDAYYGDDGMQLFHSVCAYSIVALIFLHLGGVILASARHKENLVRAMLTGRKRSAAGDDVS